MTDMDPASATRFGFALAEFAPGLCPLRAAYLLQFYGVVRFDDPVLPSDPWDSVGATTGEPFAQWDEGLNEVLLYNGFNLYLV